MNRHLLLKESFLNTTHPEGRGEQQTGGRGEKCRWKGNSGRINLSEELELLCYVAVTVCSGPHQYSVDTGVALAE